MQSGRASSAENDPARVVEVECRCLDAAWLQNGKVSSHAISLAIECVERAVRGFGSRFGYEETHADHEERHQIGHRTGDPHDQTRGRLILDGRQSANSRHLCVVRIKEPSENVSRAERTVFCTSAISR